MGDKVPATTDLEVETSHHRAVIVCSDIVGYSVLTAENEDDALTMTSVFHRQARRAAEQAQGRLVKTMGDGVLLEFEDPTSAIAAARGLAASFQAACEPLGLPERQLRVGIHRGDADTGEIEICNPDGTVAWSAPANVPDGNDDA